MTIALVCGISVTASAATLTVDNTTDAAAMFACTAAPNDCSLRGAIRAAASGDKIDFDGAVFAGSRTIQLPNGRLVINKSLTITGTGADRLTIQNTKARGTASNVFYIDSAAVNLSGMTITGGNESDGTAGGIDNSGLSTTITNCVISNNTGGIGGGISNNRNLTLLNSTVSGNTATDNFFSGGGIYFPGGTMTITNSTISGNTGTGTGTNIAGGIFVAGTLTITNSTITNNTAPAGANNASGIVNSSYGTATLRNTIVAANVNNGSVPDLTGAFTSSGFNLIGNPGEAIGLIASDQRGNSTTPLAPKLDPTLQLNGGTTPNHALLAGSPAIDKGNSFGLTTDQRGLTRPFDNPGITNATGGDGADIGAFEVQAAPTAATVSVGGRVMTSEGRGIRNVVIRLTDSEGNVRTAISNSFGYYRFNDVEAGATYILTASGKRFSFSQPSQVLNVNDETEEVNFIANPIKRFGM